MKKTLLALTLALSFLPAVTVQAANVAENLCEYTSADDKKRLRSFLRTNKIKIRNVYDKVLCNGQTLLVFADTRGSLMVGELMISKLPKKVVASEIPKLNNHHLVESAKKPRRVIEYCVWADGTTILAEEYSYEEYSFMSDDYLVLEVPEDIEEPEEWIYEQINSVNLGLCCEQRKII